MSRRFAAVCGALCLTGLAGGARAADEAAPTARRVVLEWQLGAPAPLAQMGTAVSVDALPWLSLSAGVGRSTTDWGDHAPATQAMVMPRARLWRYGDSGVWGGLGLAYGETRAENHHGLRLVGELSVEHHWPGGFQLRAFGGVGGLLHEFSTSEGGTLLPPFRAFAGVGIGYAVWPNPDLRPGPASLAGRWYGWQILALGLVGAGPYVLTVAGPGAISDDRRDLTRTEMRVAYFITGPIVHYAHHRYGRMAGSLALRAALGLLGYSIGASAVASDDPSNTYANGASITFGVIATLIDAFVLGWESPAGPQPPAPFPPETERRRSDRL